jgi:hypothetical protein
VKTVTELWLDVQPRLLRAYGLGVTVIAGAVGLNLLADVNGMAPGILMMLIFSCLALLFAGSLCLLRVGANVVRTILGGLTGGSFALGLIYLSAAPGTDADPYHILWPTYVLAGLLVVFLCLQPGFGSHGASRARLADRGDDSKE